MKFSGLLLTVGNRLNILPTVRAKLPSDQKAKSHPISIYKSQLAFANARLDQLGLKSLSAYVQGLVEYDKEHNVFSNEVYQRFLQEKSHAAEIVVTAQAKPAKQPQKCAACAK